MQITEWTWASTYPAPAKLNLFLHVVGRRADGYHLLQTVFRFIDFADQLRFYPRTDGEVEICKKLPGVPPESDLTVRAARALQVATGCRQGVTIDVEKRLPMGGGLGGGSSDAATVLLALNHLWQLGLSRQKLQDIALTLGADVPVFVFGENAFAEGVGERLQSVDLPNAWYLLLVPPVSVPTLDIFRDASLCRDTPLVEWKGWAAWDTSLGRNDLQCVAVRQHPLLAEYLSWLSAFGEARMSGSGACIFAEFSTRDAAEQAFAARPANYFAQIVQGLAKHPLRDLAFSI